CFWPQPLDEVQRAEWRRSTILRTGKSISSERTLGTQGRGGQRYDRSDSGPLVRVLLIFAGGATCDMDDSWENSQGGEKSLGQDLGQPREIKGKNTTGREARGARE